MRQGLLVAPHLACELTATGIVVKEKPPCFSLTDSFVKTVDIACKSHILVRRATRIGAPPQAFVSRRFSGCVEWSESASADSLVLRKQKSPKFLKVKNETKTFYLTNIYTSAIIATNKSEISTEDFMKKILMATLSVFALFAFFSCGSKPTAAATQAEKEGIPTWVYEGKKDSTGIYAVGAGKLSNDINSQKMAKAQARLELAQSVEVQVKGITQTLIDDQGADDDRQALAALSENAALTTEAILNGSEQVDMFKANDKTIYVLMYLPKSTFVTELTKKANSFNRTSSAAYTEQKMAEAYEKYFANNSTK